MNSVIVIGRLTRDPEVRYVATGKAVCSFTLAVDRPFTNQNGEHETDFLPVVLWNKSAELAGNSVRKGQRLCVEGRIQVRTYEDKDGIKRWVTEIVGEHIEFIEKKISIITNYNDNPIVPF